MPQYGGYFSDLTLYDNLRAISEIVITDKNQRSKRINYVTSRFELDKLSEYLINYKIKINIEGHTDSNGDSDLNLVLSNKRAKSVYDYMISKKSCTTYLRSYQSIFALFLSLGTSA